MVVNALSAEAAGHCFRAWRLIGSPARGKEGWPVSQTHGQVQMDGGGGGLAPAGKCPSLRHAGRVVSRCREKDLAGEASFA